MLEGRARGGALLLSPAGGIKLGRTMGVRFSPCPDRGKSLVERCGVRFSPCPDRGKSLVERCGVRFSLSPFRGDTDRLNQRSRWNRHACLVVLAASEPLQYIVHVFVFCGKDRRL